MIYTLYEPFRHWSEGGSIYILSDLHFDDFDCRLMDPTWITPQEQIDIINKTVMKNDTFICLGDVGCADYVREIKSIRCTEISVPLPVMRVRAASIPSVDVPLIRPMTSIGS